MRHPSCGDVIQPHTSYGNCVSYSFSPPPKFLVCHEPYCFVSLPVQFHLILFVLFNLISLYHFNLFWHVRYAISVCDSSGVHCTHLMHCSTVVLLHCAFLALAIAFWVYFDSTAAESEPKESKSGLFSFNNFLHKTLILSDTLIIRIFMLQEQKLYISLALWHFGTLALASLCFSPYPSKKDKRFSLQSFTSCFRDLQ